MSEGNGAAKRVVCLGMPSYGELTAAAAQGYYGASKGDLIVHRLHQQSSLLASNMNVLWCWALNTARKQRVDYFAMLHADVEPEIGWLDKLVAELEARGLDVLGVVCPIKDQRGVTSTALGRPDGDTWRVHGRLTMKEVWQRLPETFTSADVGHDLLINTGCWVCRFDEEWCRKVHFTVNDRIAYDPVKEIYFAQVEPEDWFVSRLFHELGLKVGCTRKVELGHRGPMSFGNTEPWGSHEWDREYLPEPPLGERADWFPHDAAGWLTVEEGQELARLAEGKSVLEIGAYCGRSTICLAQKSKSVSVVDTFDGRGTALEGNTEPAFKRNLRRHGVADRVTAYKGESLEVLPRLPPVYDLVFIDGAHDWESVMSDALEALNVLKPGGLLVFHDYSNPNDPEVKEAVDDLVSRGAEIVGRCGTLAVVRPAGNLVTV